MHNLASLMAERISAGLQRRTLTTPSRWACNCRVMKSPFPGKWNHRHHPWLKEMQDSDAQENVGPKGAQMGFTEAVLNISFFSMDVKGIDVLYVLPSQKPDASDFSAARFDAALELSPHLGNMFSDVKNVGHKTAGAVNFYLRGSKSRGGLKSIPVGLVILDELDEMDQDNVPLAWERMAGQPEKSIWKISTPTINNYGINKEYIKSSQNHFYFKCPSCSRFTELLFPDSLIITADDLLDQENLAKSHLICKECKNKLPQIEYQLGNKHMGADEAKADWLESGKWIETIGNRDIKGWHIPQLYSTTVHPPEIAAQYLKAQLDKSEEQEFWNSKMGMPHEVKGARITDEEINACKGEYINEQLDPSGLITMGIDVGTWCHYEICQWTQPQGIYRGADINMMSHCKMIAFGKVRSFDELDHLMWRFRVAFAVIDAQPERRKSIEFCNRFYGHARACFYPQGVNGKEIHINKDEPSISVDRTSWLDLSLGRFFNKRITIPKNVSVEYCGHVKAIVRTYEKDQWGNPVGVYVTGTEEDHHAHARNYAEIALPLAMSVQAAKDISGVM